MFVYFRPNNNAHVDFKPAHEPNYRGQLVVTKAGNLRQFVPYDSDIYLYWPCKGSPLNRCTFRLNYINQEH